MKKYTITIHLRKIDYEERGLADCYVEGFYTKPPNNVDYDYWFELLNTYYPDFNSGWFNPENYTLYRQDTTINIRPK